MGSVMHSVGNVLLINYDTSLIKLNYNDCVYNISNHVCYVWTVFMIVNLLTSVLND